MSPPGRLEGEFRRARHEGTPVSFILMTRWRRAAAALLAGACFALPAQADDLRVLSAGAIEPGIRPVIAAFEQRSGHRVTLNFATAPQIRQRIEAGEAFDLVLAPPAVLDAIAPAAGTTGSAPRVPIGSVGIGVAVRPGAALPQIATAESFTQALREADSLVFNRASTGLYIERLLKQLGLDAEMAGKTTRYADGAAVMDHVLHGHGRELALGAITEIRLVRDRGLQFAGPLPPPLQNTTAYFAIPLRTPPSDAVQALLRDLGSPDARATYGAAGIGPAR
jgi:molybdate transport system substrate-binding protein